MKRVPFARPTTYYDVRINAIDEQLCELIKRRKEISDNNPGFPPFFYNLYPAIRERKYCKS